MNDVKPVVKRFLTTASRFDRPSRRSGLPDADGAARLCAFRTQRNKGAARFYLTNAPLNYRSRGQSAHAPSQMVACRSTIGSLSVNSLALPFRRRMRQPATLLRRSLHRTSKSRSWRARVVRYDRFILGRDLSIAVGNIKVGSIVDLPDGSHSGKCDIVDVHAELTHQGS